MAKLLGLYIHIPFCRRKCDYCDFYSLAGEEEQMDLYLKALLAHIKQSAAPLKTYQVDTIYFGGGTPSYFGEKRLRALLLAIRKYFSVSRAPEITLECNPDSVDKRSLLRLRRAGFNRISLGMQTADCDQLRALHRLHDFAQVKAAVQLIREAKFENLSLDLIYGLPGQSLESWEDTLMQALDLQPEHISAYGLKVEADTPLSLRVARGETLPDEDLQADMYLHLTSCLPRAGFRQYEISNFAKTGRESRHNLKYWMGREYFGFGPGAHSDLDGRRFAYRRDLQLYMDSALAELPLPESIEEISAEERAREYLMFRLRTLRGIEEWEYRREFSHSFEPLQRKLELFESRGWAAQGGRRWHLTPEGFLLSNALIGELLEAQGVLPSVNQERAEPCIPLFTPKVKKPGGKGRISTLVRKKRPAKAKQQETDTEEV